jgi:23S rRNA pseudouridine2605 synthase
VSRLRLQVILARAGVASRRKAESFILDGRVAVNGRIVTTLGEQADPDVDKVTVDGEALASEAKLVLLLHKPDAVVSTASDPEGRETVVDLVDQPVRLVPVGRLDFHSEGALLLTNDGEFHHRLTHPKFQVPKMYWVKVPGSLKSEAVAQFERGVRLEDGVARAQDVRVVAEEGSGTWLTLTVTDGRNRLIRRICEALGHRVLRLVRHQIGAVELGDLRPGQYRALSHSELNGLYRFVELAPPSELSPLTRSLGRGAWGEVRRRRGWMPGEARRS